MQSIHQIKADKINQLLSEMAAYIRSHDSSYERELDQVYEIQNMLANLVRYSEAIDDRLQDAGRF